MDKPMKRFLLISGSFLLTALVLVGCSGTGKTVGHDNNTSPPAQDHVKGFALLTVDVLG